MSIHLSIFVSICLYIYLSIFPTIYLHICISIYLSLSSVYLSIHLSIYLSRMARAGASVVGVNCHFDPFVSLETLAKMKQVFAVKVFKTIEAQPFKECDEIRAVLRASLHCHVISLQ